MSNKKITPKAETLPVRTQPDSRVWLFIIFMEGFLVMAVELLGTGLIAPHFGSGLTVWTYVLGITMTGLACGYFWGSKLAQKENALKLCINLLLAIGLAIFLMTDIRTFMIRSNLDSGLYTVLLVCVLPFLFPPLFLLGSLSPVVIHQLARFRKNSGVGAGSGFSLSTVGGIISALLTAFLLMHYLTVPTAVMLISMLAFSTTLFLFFKYYSDVRKWLLAGGMIFLLLFYSKSTSKHYAEILPKGYLESYSSDGILGQIRVIENQRNQTRSLYVNNTIQSVALLNGTTLWPYINQMSQLTSAAGSNQILLAGMGGGLLYAELKKHSKQLDVIDLDGRMFEVSERCFGIHRRNGDRYFKEDLRYFVRHEPAQYDAIVVDLSAAEVPPLNVYTCEGFADLKRRLKPNGILLIHYFSNYEADGLKTIRAIGRSMQQAGFQVSLLDGEHKKDELSSLVFVAGRRHQQLVRKAGLSIQQISFKGGVLLTDEQPLLDLMRKDMTRFTRKNYVDSYRKNWEIIRLYGLDE